MANIKRITYAALLAASVSAQVVSYSDGSYAISVNVPVDTARSGSGPIYLQLSAPTSAQWVGFGQGTRMDGANMFLMYAQSDSNVTVSPRTTSGHNMPEHDGSAQITILEGTGIQGNTMVANIRCDSCLSWSGGSMSATSSSSDWIYAYREAESLNTNDVSASLQMHDRESQFNLDLTQGIGGDSANPFVQATSSDPTSSGSNPTASATNSVSAPIATSNPNSASSSSSSRDNTSQLRLSHGVIMSLLFVGLFPIFALTLYLPTSKKVRFIHAPLQVLSLVLLIVGMALGIVLGTRLQELDGYHQVLGFIIVAIFVLFQPAMGLYQHLHYSRTGTRSSFGHAHRWTGRLVMILGVINGGLGFSIAGNTGAYIPYSVVAVIVFLIYIGVIAFDTWQASKKDDNLVEKTGSPQSGYEMHLPKQSRHSRIPSDPNNAHAAR